MSGTVAKRRPNKAVPPEPPENPWPERLRALRAKHGDGTRSLTQAAAAARARVALRTWISWENGHRTPGRLALILLKDAFPKDF